MSLLYKLDLNKKLLNELAKKYNINLNRIRDIITKSSKEYAYFFPEAENLRKLKALKIELLKKMNI